MLKTYNGTTINAVIAGNATDADWNTCAAIVRTLATAVVAFHDTKHGKPAKTAMQRIASAQRIATDDASVVCNMCAPGSALREACRTERAKRVAIIRAGSTLYDEGVITAAKECVEWMDRIIKGLEAIKPHVALVVPVMSCKVAA